MPTDSITMPVQYLTKVSFNSDLVQIEISQDPDEHGERDDYVVLSRSQCLKLVEFMKKHGMAE